MDPSLWARCMLSDTESVSSPPLCPPEFVENALFFLERVFGMSVPDITHENCTQVYTDLVSVLEIVINN